MDRRVTKDGDSEARRNVRAPRQQRESSEAPGAEGAVKHWLQLQCQQCGAQFIAPADAEERPLRKLCSGCAFGALPRRHNKPR
jgi:hypothetical protein